LAQGLIQVRVQIAWKIDRPKRKPGPIEPTIRGGAAGTGRRMSGFAEN
jgi:hypothetical protein